MTVDKYGLDDIIRESYKEFKGYLKRAGIEIKDVRLRILESSDLLRELYDMIKTCDINKLKHELNTIDKSSLEKIFNDNDIYIINEDNLRKFYIGQIYLLRQIYNTDDIKELNNKILEHIVNLIENEKLLAIVIPETKEIYIIKDRLKERIDETLNTLGPININGPSIIRLGWPLFDVVSAPLYTKEENIKEDLAKVFAANVIIYEMGRFIVGREELENKELSVSALQYIMYIDMYKLLKHPKTYEIIEENIIECKKYIEKITTFMANLTDGNFPISLLKDYFNVLRIAPYDLGQCYANIIIDRNKKTSYLNIKDVIEEVKNLSISDTLTKIAYY
jgi:hypothetical protein